MHIYFVRVRVTFVLPALNLMLLAPDLITKTLEFVYAWSLSAVLESLFFGVFPHCVD